MRHARRAAGWQITMRGFAFTGADAAGDVLHNFGCLSRGPKQPACSHCSFLYLLASCWQRRAPCSYMSHSIIIRGARQNNLRNLDLDLPTHELIVVTGVSGSGKSSLVFDSLYAEGQRRYVETFSAYARQFLDRMDKPQVDRIEGIPPAIAIDQTNPVRNSRSTVGTMTELNDHLKLLYARAAQLFCSQCARAVRRDTPESIIAEVGARLAAGEVGNGRLLVTFPVAVPQSFSEQEVLELLAKQGYTRIHARHAGAPAARRKRTSKKQASTASAAPQAVLEVIQDRLRFDAADPARMIEALEAALRVGRGRVSVHALPADTDARVHDTATNSSKAWKFSTDLHCAECDLHFQEPLPSLFSFNSPIGACESCRGFGRIIGIDFGLIIPDASKSLADGAIRPWQTESYSECQDDLIKLARKRGVPVDVPWRDLSEAHQHWVLEGEGDWRAKVWYGVRRFFAWLETKSYKMHIRVLLSKYRAYTECSTCRGARLKPQALSWRVGCRGTAEPGLNIREMMLLPLEQLHAFFVELQLPPPFDQAADLLLREVRSRLRFLLDVGLGYLTLDRQSRTLSGGEVQRINLTTALGTSLVNSLFVLDEPSIGLHPRDMGRVIEVMQRLRQAGNSLVVVEHDPQVMQAADRILDIGPGPGERGGRIVFYGPPEDLANAAESLTADYLTGRRQVQPPSLGSQEVTTADDFLVVRGASAHNLRGIDVHIPLRRMVCITGVSGSGKSTLVQDVLYPALLKHFGKPTANPGEHQAVQGTEHLSAVVLVDQAPIGRTTRSNPASYVGAFDCIRKLFAAQPLARERKYTLGTFSFNSGSGRCPTCSGNGFEHVEMQFLSDVYLRCPDCDGKRYRPEILDVRLQLTGGNRSVAEVLEMTVSEALDYFDGQADVTRALQPLVEVGLDYVKLGQPVPTLSGGEAQRLKLAGHLVTAADNAASRAGRRRTLFLFDEPTTGLHFDDIAKLLRALRRLVAGGDSLLIIEHNLDLIAASDWLIDLGPEGGAGGGQVVCAGTAQAVMQCAASHTGAALRDYRDQFTRATNPWLVAARGESLAIEEKRRVASPAAAAVLSIHGAREHNLKNIDVSVPRERFSVITGVSGSGKSTLAFDIIFGEGQRRYLESINAYARQFIQPPARPDVDAIFGIPPTVAIEQRTSRGGLKSTVATATEIYHFLRLLYVKLGTQHCPGCAVPIEPQSFQAILAGVLRDYRRRTVTLLAPLVVARKGYYTDLAAWAAKKGYAQLRVDGQWLDVHKWPRLDRFKEHTLELPVATIHVTPAAEPELQRALALALEFGKGVAGVIEAQPDGERPARKSTAVPAVQLFSTRRACPKCGTSFAELDPRLFSFNSKHGWCHSCFGTGLQLQGFEAEHSGEEGSWSDGVPQACGGCAGQRLNPIALNVLWFDQSIAQFTQHSVTQLRAKLAKLKLQGREAQLARDVLVEISARLGFLEEVGLGYLALDRAAPTLSGGEAQRIRLAAQLGSTLQGVCYVLDEPTIGLHPRDNQVLLRTLERLAAKGNTLIVVEHDEDTIRRADHVLDLGPGAGSRGGQVVAAGTASELARCEHSLTGRFLATPLRHPLAARRSIDTQGPALTIHEAQLHNLQGVTVRVPLQRLVVVTGVSGSGKSTLARDVLHDNLRMALTGQQSSRSAQRWQGCREIEGWEAIGRILEVDQTPIGKTPRSCPATYVGFWDAIRTLFATTTEARMRGFDAARFSFNTGGGRCPVCEGQGVRRIEMSFLPDVSVACEQCHGRRFNAETLAVEYRGKSIGEVLLMSVDTAVDFFAAHSRIHHALRLLQEVGLGYLTLGQQSPTLSGGEAQRLKLVTELAKVPLQGQRELRSRTPATLYVLDEPTVGLHMADVEKLIRVLHRLVDLGNSMVVIEHNLDVMAEADWLIDLGPEGGAGGGRVVAQGAPEKVARQASRSHTARVLRDFLEERSSGL
jgi:excinuclease ABC subunit A